MKKLFAVFLALVLACSCLAGCGKHPNLGGASTGTQEVEERFVDLNDGEKAFNFTAEEFKNNFNRLTANLEEKIGDWEQDNSDSGVFYTYKYGEGFHLVVLADSETEFIKFVMISYDLSNEDDAYLWGKTTASLFSAIDSSLDSEAKKDLLEKLDLADIDSWHAGKDTYTTKNGIHYSASIDESYNVIISALPLPDGTSSDTSSRVNEMPSLQEEVSSKQSVTMEQVLLDQSGIKITFTGVKEERSYTNLKLKIENNTDIPITVQERDMSINDIMISGVFSPTVAAGKTANDEISIFTSDLEENSITQIENVELKFLVFNDDTLDTILESQVIAFNIQ